MRNLESPLQFVAFSVLPPVSHSFLSFADLFFFSIILVYEVSSTPDQESLFSISDISA